MERRTATNDGQGTGKREQEGDVAPEQQNAHPNQRIETQQNQEAIGNGEPPQERSWCCGICPGRSFRWLFSKPKGTSQYFEKLNSELSSLQLEVSCGIIHHYESAEFCILCNFLFHVFSLSNPDRKHRGRIEEVTSTTKEI